MNMKALILLAPLAVLTAGCQIGHKHTAGEEIVMSSKEASPVGEPVTRPATTTVAVATAPAPVTGAAADVTTSGKGTGVVAAAPTTGPTVVATPATTPATTSPADRGPRIYVAADADDATLLRNWRPVANVYPSGHAIAGPTYRIIAPPPRSNDWTDTYAVDLFQTFLSLPQMIGTPVWAVVTPPWTPVEYHGEQFPPSYTVDDPLPYYVNEKVPGMIQMKRDK
jgi:hypothetical protein